MDALPRRLRAAFPPVRPLVIDVFKFALLAAALTTLMIRIKDGLNYRWEWSALPQYLFRFDGEQGREFER